MFVRAERDEEGAIYRERRLRNKLILFENPLIIQIEEQLSEFQAELCDLQNDLFLKTRLEKGVEFFKILDISN
jgi:hypothetical protein